MRNAIIAPMLTGKSSFTHPLMVDTDTLADHHQLVSEHGEPSPHWTEDEWMTWNAHRAHNILTKLPRSPLIALLVHDRFTAALLGTQARLAVIIPSAEFDRRCRIEPTRANLARFNRKQVMADLQERPLPIVTSLETAAIAYTALVYS
jgi:hypothetical protein